MTEQEWLNCTDPKTMLEFLEGKASDRKLRLFTCACCRSLWDLLKEQCLKDAVEATEKFADCQIAVERLTELSEEAWNTKYRLEEVEAEEEDDEAIFCAASAVAQASCGPGNSDIPYIFRTMDVAMFASDAGRLTGRNQTHLLREVIGNPFCLQPSIDSLWLSWNDGTVPKVAQAIYNDRAFDRMPILADALEEAGCTNAEILNHCRLPSEHVRGCWVVDLLLGKS